MARPAKTAMRQMDQHKQLAREKVDRRLGTATARPDFMSYVLRHGDDDDDEKGMSRQEMYGNMSTIIAAGSKTTATLLTGATWCLHQPQHRPILEKVVAEIRSTFTTAKDITLANVGKCEYLLAVIDEAFRIYPPARWLAGQPRLVPEATRADRLWLLRPGRSTCPAMLPHPLPLPPPKSFQTSLLAFVLRGGRRCKAANKQERGGFQTGIQVNGFRGLALRAQLRRPRSFYSRSAGWGRCDLWMIGGRRCSRFRSGRGIVSGRSKSCSVPGGGGGVRDELLILGGWGGSLALAEIRLALAHMLWFFDMEVGEETDAEWADQKAWFTWEKKPLVMRLRARLA